MLEQVQDFLNNNDAVANASGVINFVLFVVMMKISSAVKKKATEIMNNDKKQVPESKIDKLIDNQVKNNKAIQNLNHIIMKFSMATNIDGKDKEEILTVYNDVKNNAIDLSNEAKALIENTVNETKELIDQVEEKTKESKQQVNSVMDRYRKELSDQE